VEWVTAAPESGIWRLEDDGRMVYRRFDYHRRGIESEQEGFYLRIIGSGDYFYKGADLGIMITRGRLMNDDFTLNERAKRWIRDIRSACASQPLDKVRQENVPVSLDAGAFKIL
jgi:hypothetical protein